MVVLKKRGGKVNAWIEYEKEKKKIAETAESAEEYERKIKELVERLGL